MPVLGKKQVETLIMDSKGEAGNVVGSGARIVLSTNLTAGMAAEMAKTAEQDNEVDAIFDVLASLITEWDFEDENGQPMPVTRENMRLLSMPDFMQLSTFISSKLETLNANGKIPAAEKKD